MARDRDQQWSEPHELRSFGRRHGRKLSPRQDALLRDLLPRVRVDLSRPLLFPPPLRGRCPEGAEGGEPQRLQTASHPPPALRATSPTRGEEKAPPLWLEIGFGGGEHLVWQARHNPSVCLIGCEPFEEGVVKVLSAIETERLDNIRLHADDARPVLRWLPASSVTRAFILFPDPWPKKRHVKRRLVSPATLAMLARVLQPGAELRIATDIGDYARTILLAVAETPQLEWTAQAAADWRIRPPDWPQTRYEAKAVREGRCCYYLRFRRIGTSES